MTTVAVPDAAVCSVTAEPRTVAVTTAAFDVVTTYGPCPPPTVKVRLFLGGKFNDVGMLVNRAKPDPDDDMAATVTKAVCVTPLLSITLTSAPTPSATPVTVTTLPDTDATSTNGDADTAV